MRAVIRVSLLALAFAMPAGPASPQSAQSAAERDYAEYVKFVDAMEQLLKSTEEARLRGDCSRLEYNASSFNYDFHWGPIEHNIPAEQLADWKRRRDELYARPCPPTEAVAPQSTTTAKTPEPEPSSAPGTDDSGDIFDNPDNAKAGIGLTPMDEPGGSVPPAGSPQPGPKKPEPEPSSAPETDDSGDIFDNPNNAKAGVGLTPMDEPAKSPTKGEPPPPGAPPPGPPEGTPPESGAGAAGLPPLETLPQLPRRTSDGTPDPPKGPDDVSPNPRPPGQEQEMPPTPPAPTESTGTIEPAPQTTPPARRRKRDESPNPPKQPGDPSPNPTPDGR